MNVTEMNHKITQSRFKHPSEHPNKGECLEVTEADPCRGVKERTPVRQNHRSDPAWRNRAGLHRWDRERRG